MSTDAIVVVVVVGLVTYLIRVSFLAFADRFAELPPGVERVLRQIPPAVLAALVAPSILQPGGRFSLWSPELVAGLLAGFVAWRTRSALGSLVVGMIAIVVLSPMF